MVNRDFYRVFTSDKLWRRLDVYNTQTDIHGNFQHVCHTDDLRGSMKYVWQSDWIQLSAVSMWKTNRYLELGIMVRFPEALGFALWSRCENLVFLAGQINPKVYLYAHHDPPNLQQTMDTLAPIYVLYRPRFDSHPALETKEYILKALQLTSEKSLMLFYLSLPEHFRTDLDIAKAISEHDDMFWGYSSPQITNQMVKSRADELKLARILGASLPGLYPKFHDDKELLEEALRGDKHLMGFITKVSPRLQQDRDFVFKAVTASPDCFCMVLSRWRNDLNFVEDLAKVLTPNDFEAIYDGVDEPLERMLARCTEHSYSHIHAQIIGMDLLECEFDYEEEVSQVDIERFEKMLESGIKFNPGDYSPYLVQTAETALKLIAIDPEVMEDFPDWIRSDEELVTALCLSKKQDTLIRMTDEQFGPPETIELAKRVLDGDIFDWQVVPYFILGDVELSIHFLETHKNPDIRWIKDFGTVEVISRLAELTKKPLPMLQPSFLARGTLMQLISKFGTIDRELLGDPMIAALSVNAQPSTIALLPDHLHNDEDFMAAMILIQPKAFAYLPTTMLSQGHYCELLVSTISKSEAKRRLSAYISKMQEQFRECWDGFN